MGDLRDQVDGLTQGNSEAGDTTATYNVPSDSADSQKTVEVDHTVDDQGNAVTTVYDPSTGTTQSETQEVERAD